MDLRIITVGKLEAFVEEAAFANLADIPISPLRAFSQAQNPNAELDDPALVIAYDKEEQVLAYFGCLPDRLQKNNSEEFCWSSCWWVHPNKGQAAAMPVFYKALQLWNAKMLFDALPERSEAVLGKMGYFSFHKMEGIHSFLRFKLHKIIPTRVSLLAPLKNVFFVLDVLLNIPNQIRLNFWKRKNTFVDSIKIKRINTIDQETETFIHSLSKNDLIKRNSSNFNWIIQNPWLSSNKTYTSNYFFSSHADHFENILLKIHHGENMIAFLWLTLRDGTAKLPYCYISPGSENIAANILINQLIENPVDTFICFQQNILSAIANNKAPFLHQKEVSKTFGWTNTLDTFFEYDPYIQDGDGDGVFT